jgi:hypothetical protein
LNLQILAALAARRASNSASCLMEFASEKKLLLLLHKKVFGLKIILTSFGLTFREI